MATKRKRQRKKRVVVYFHVVGASTGGYSCVPIQARRFQGAWDIAMFVPEIRKNLKYANLKFNDLEIQIEVRSTENYESNVMIVAQYILDFLISMDEPQTLVFNYVNFAFIHTYPQPEALVFAKDVACKMAETVMEWEFDRFDVRGLYVKYYPNKSEDDQFIFSRKFESS